MKMSCRSFVTVLGVLLCGVFQAGALVTVENRMEVPDLFSDAFKRDYAAAVHSGDTNALIAFEKMLSQYKLPHEQAELETVIGMRYGQTRGLTNHAKAAEHLGKALTFELPPTVRLEIHLRRGNSYERLKRNQEALTEYLKGMVICLNYELPQSKPQVQAVSAYHWLRVGDDPDGRTAFQKYMAERKRKIEARNKAVFELKLADLRFYVIEASKRVGSDANNVRSVAKTTVSDEARVQKLVELFSAPNKRLWE